MGLGEAKDRGQYEHSHCGAVHTIPCHFDLLCAAGTGNLELRRSRELCVATAHWKAVGGKQLLWCDHPLSNLSGN